MGARILIAEDEPFIIESLTFLLSRKGHIVSSVPDGNEVLKTLQLYPQDLLILDIMMPSSNGFDILQKIRATPWLKELPVLVLTAKGQDSDRRRMLDLGANFFMTKPFSNEGLVAKVAELLSEGAEQNRKVD